MNQNTVVPVEVRALYATAFNLLNANDAGDTERTARKIERLRDAVKTMEPIMKAHFANQNNQ